MPKDDSITQHMYTGLMIGGYRVFSQLGQGSLATAYAVTRRDSSDPLVMKLLNPGLNRHLALRMYVEAEVLAQFGHPAIPRWIDTGQAGDRPYIVMTLARGSSLRSMLLSRGQWAQPVEEMAALWFATNVLDALDHVHDRGWVHRDVKDDNVVVEGPRGVVHLIDFGFCCECGQQTSEREAGKHGALRFAPPSQLRNPTYADPLDDVFSVGVIGYLALTGLHPWLGRARADRVVLARAMENRRPTDIYKLNPKVSRPVSQLFASLLIIDRNKRPSARTAAEQARQLLSFEDN